MIVTFLIDELLTAEIELSYIQSIPLIKYKLGPLEIAILMEHYQNNKVRSVIPNEPLVNKR
jgi:hypothetical protein